MKLSGAKCIELPLADCYLSRNKGWTMASRDRYSRKLECAKCGHSGFAEASEQDEKRTANVDFRIDEMPQGFRAERPSTNPAEYMIRCGQCGNIFRFLQKVTYAPGGEPWRGRN
jgi:transcription elongation factor Elf1